MSRNPRALAHLEQLMAVELESTAADEGDTCADRDGVDCIPYIVEEPTQIELSIADDAQYLAELVLVDASGAIVLRAVRGDEAGSALLDPGSYRLELHHLDAGDAAAPEQMVFLRPDTPIDATAGRVSGLASQRTETEAPRNGSTTSPHPAAPNALHTVSLTAQMNCVKCDFTGARLEAEHFDGLVLTGSTFNRAYVMDTTFRGAMMADCHFLDLYSVYPGEQRGTVWEMASIDADFTGAVLSRAEFSLRALRAERLHFAGVFRGAKLDGSVWKGKVTSTNQFNVLFNADFRNADLTNSRWEEETTLLKRKAQPNTPQCTFQGADLTGARFTGKIKADLNQCRFDKEPDTGRVTILRGVDLTGVNVANTTMADADLTDTTLDRTIMEGTDLSRANLSRAKIRGVRWRAAILAGATITGIMPPTLNGLDLTKTDFTGVNFAGLDLSQTDLSQAVLDAAPRLAGAKLSDGMTRGINLAGHRFAERYDTFKGAELSGVNLSQTELFGADLERATLNNANLIGANLNFANLRGALLRGATLGVQPGTEAAAATLRGAFMPDIDLTDADLRSVDLTAAHLYGDVSRTLLVRTRLDSATFVNTICSGAHFSGSLNNTVFAGAQLVNTVFNGATLTGAKLDDAYLQGADFSSAVSVTGAVLSNAAVSGAPGTWQFKEQDGTPFTIRYEATKLGALASDRSVRCPNGTLGPCCPSNDLAQCLTEKLKPARSGPFPPIPSCVPKPPRYDNCITPMPTATRRATPTATPRLG